MTREQAEALYGPIKIWNTGGPRECHFEAYFDDRLDYDMPGWARGFGPTEGNAISALLEQAADHAAETIPPFPKGLSDLQSVFDRLLGIDRIEEQAAQVIAAAREKERREARHNSEMHENELQRRSGC